MTTKDSPAKSGARFALGLLLAINLFNYIDRFVLAAVEPNIRATFFAATDPNAMARTGLLAPAFLITYMLAAPILGFLADRFSRWLIVGVCVILWSFATAASGFAATFAALFITRIFVGIGEGGYGPAAPTILSDYFPLQMRGPAMAVCTMFNWGFNFLIAYTFLSLTTAITKQGTFWLYAFFGICAVIFFVTLVPETKDRSLEEIQSDLGADADAALTREREPEPAQV